MVPERAVAVTGFARRTHLGGEVRHRVKEVAAPVGGRYRVCDSPTTLGSGSTPNREVRRRTFVSTAAASSLKP